MSDTTGAQSTRYEQIRTALGIGERCGNAQMDILLVNLRLEGILDRDLTRLGDYVRKVSEATGVPIPFNYPIFGEDAFRTSTGVHAAAVIFAIAYFSWWGVLLAIGSYFVRMVIVTAAYHRYFSHRAFKTSRVFQFLLALGAQSSAQKGVLWWAGHHRHHHKHSDAAEDIHSARRSGFQ